MEDQSITQPFALGRLPSSDERDNKFLLKKLLIPSTRTSRYWNDGGWWGNQKQDPFCVGYSWAHWIEDGPIAHAGPAPKVDPTYIYKEAQKVDEWPGIDYEGTSVRAGAKVLQAIGRISEYNWAWDLETLVNAVLTVGPVVVGTRWFENMFYPSPTGLISIGGEIMGGHAYVINGVNTKTKLFRIKNSWGKDWGKNGRAYISFADTKKLIEQDGEICLGVEIKS